MNVLAVPSRTIELMKNDFYRSAALNIRRLDLLARVLKALNAAGAPAIVLKGAYLAEAVYGNIALRTMADLDLLVRRSDLEKADTALSSAGCKRREYHLLPPENDNEFHYRHASVRTMIEIHWEIVKPTYPFALAAADVWEAAVPVRIAGVDTLALSPEDLLLHLGLHASIHCYDYGLRPICDIAETLARFPVNPGVFLRRMRRYGLSFASGFPLLLAHRLLGAPIPKQIVDHLGPLSPPDNIRAAALQAVFLERPGRADDRAAHPNMVLFMGRKNWLDKLALAAQKVFPPRKMIAARYGLPPASLRVFFYYLNYLRALFKSNAPAIRSYVGGLLGRRPAEADTAALMDWLMRKR
jgi:hypothetical protein